MSISATPSDSLIHETVHICVDGLKPHVCLRIELRLLHKTGIYRSYGIFKTNVIGSVDLKHDAPLRGTYSGISLMGLFESVEQTDTVRYGGYCNCTPPEAFIYELRLFDLSGNLISMKQVVKRLCHPDVERIEIEYSVDESRPKVTGTIFKPPGSGPFPTIIDISGTGGGINEQKAAALASRGFCALSLAFFQYKDLPDQLEKVDVQYFEDAINYIISLPFTSDRIGFQGVSFGGTLVMYLATIFPVIKAVVAINGSAVMDEFAYINIYGKKPSIGIFRPNLVDLKYLNDTMCYDKVVRNSKSDEKARFRLEDSSKDTAFRFVSSMDDLSTPTVFVTNFLSQELRKLKRYVEVQFLNGGHLMDPPCFPSHSVVFSKFSGTNQAYGGENSQHGKSEFDAWHGTIKFFSKHLGKPTPLGHYARENAKL